MTHKPSTSKRHCPTMLSPIVESSPLLPPIEVWASSQLHSSVVDHSLTQATDQGSKDWI